MWTEAQKAELRGLMTLPACNFYFTSDKVPPDARISFDDFPPPATPRGMELLAADLLEIACMYAKADAAEGKKADVIEIKAGPLALKKTARGGVGTGVMGDTWCARAERLRPGEDAGKPRRAAPILAAGLTGSNPIPVFAVNKSPEGFAGLSDWDHRTGLAAWLRARGYDTRGTD